MALGLGGGLREAGLDFSGASFLGHQAFFDGGQPAGRAEFGDEPAEEKGSEGGADLWQVALEFQKHDRQSKAEIPHL